MRRKAIDRSIYASFALKSNPVCVCCLAHFVWEHVVWNSILRKEGVRRPMMICNKAHLSVKKNASSRRHRSRLVEPNKFRRLRRR